MNLEYHVKWVLDHARGALEDTPFAPEPRSVADTVLPLIRRNKVRPLHLSQKVAFVPFHLPIDDYVGAHRYSAIMAQVINDPVLPHRDLLREYDVFTHVLADGGFEHYDYISELLPAQFFEVRNMDDLRKGLRVVDSAIEQVVRLYTH